MEENELKELLFKQQDQILTLQILVQCLVDELVETKIVSEKELDTRLSDKVIGIKEQLKEIKKSQLGNIPFNFGGPMGEA